MAYEGKERNYRGLTQEMVGSDDAAAGKEGKQAQKLEV